MRWVPRRGRSALCCERRTELAPERGRAAVLGVSLLADTDCTRAERWGLQGTCPPPPFNLCVFGSYLTRNYSSVCI